MKASERITGKKRCELCHRPGRIKGERYCPYCRRIVLNRIRRSYPDDRPAGSDGMYDDEIHDGLDTHHALAVRSP